jgi:hypothetical protein
MEFGSVALGRQPGSDAVMREEDTIKVSVINVHTRRAKKKRNPKVSLSLSPSLSLSLSVLSLSLCLSEYVKCTFFKAEKEPETKSTGLSQRTSLPLLKRNKSFL